ncbi:MAG: hypothetical protein ACMUEM_03035 [Flavobacteriales bacterium AspAUS03]
MAEWITANPTIYRVGLAFQAVFPNTFTFWVMIISGALVTVVVLFPTIAMKLLDFVVLYGFILPPIGVIIAFEYFLVKDLTQ